ncbi:MAG: threonylcarbamoyl-AMP synthase [Chloroflexi bacterium]|nr:threonylcarbamoyl-AMP synthase [Chloroflexota bacterium]
MTKPINTTTHTIDPQTPDPAILAQAATIIKNGGLVAFPTETVYGLGADALNADAVRRIFTAKGRPAYDPVIIHVANATELDRIASSVSPTARQLAAHFWPGALTLVLPKANIVPTVVTADGPTVAVRCPNHPLAQALIRMAGTPIAAPSANRFSHTSPTTAQHVWADLAGRIEMILDGGATSIGIESTVLDVTGDVPRILRPGGVTAEALTAVLPYITTPDQPTTPKTIPSPGMLDRHYAPDTELWLFNGPDDAVRQAMRETAVREMRNGRVALMLAIEDEPYFADLDLSIGIIGSLYNLENIAQNLFSTMRLLDTATHNLILARNYPATGLGSAIRDRLHRAAQRVIQIDG